MDWKFAQVFEIRHTHIHPLCLKIGLQRRDLEVCTILIAGASEDLS